MAVTAAVWGAAGAGCFWIGGSLLWGLFYGIGGLLLYVGLHAHALRSIDAARSVERTMAAAGSEIRVAVSLKIRSWIPVFWIVVEQPWTRQGKPFAVHRRLAMARCGTRLRFTCKFPDLDRGEYAADTLLVYAGDLFGFYMKRYEVHAPVRFLVHPRSDAVLYIPSASVFTEDSGLRGIRDYIPGDPLNRIHWKASAAADRWKTKLLEAEPEEQILIALDGGYRDAAHLEKAVEAAAGLARAAYESECQVGIDCCGTGMAVKPGRSRSLSAVLDMLSRIDDPEERHVDSWLARLGRSAGNRTHLCFVTGNLDPRRFRVLRQLKQGGTEILVLAVCAEAEADPQTAGLMRLLEELGCRTDLIRFRSGEAGIREGGRPVA